MAYGLKASSCDPLTDFDLKECLVCVQFCKQNIQSDIFDFTVILHFESKIMFMLFS